MFDIFSCLFQLELSSKIYFIFIKIILFNTLFSLWNNDQCARVQVVELNKCFNNCIYMYRQIKVVLLRKLCESPFLLLVRCKKKNVLFKYVLNIILLKLTWMNVHQMEIRLKIFLNTNSIQSNCLMQDLNFYTQYLYGAVVAASGWNIYFYTQGRDIDNF